MQGKQLINLQTVEEQLRKLKRFRLLGRLVPVYQRIRNKPDAPVGTAPNPMAAPHYPEWRAQVEPELTAPAVNSGFTISIVMPVYKPDLAFLREAIASVQDQTYQDWELCICDDASSDEATTTCLAELCLDDPRIKFVQNKINKGISATTNCAANLATGRFIAFMDQDDMLTRDALSSIFLAVEESPLAKLIYSDEDKLSATGEREIPHFKPDFNYQLLLSQNYICHLLVIERKLFNQLDGCRSKYDGAQDHDLILRAIETLNNNEIVHIRRILYHWRAHETSTANNLETKPRALEAGREAIESHLARNFQKGEVQISNIRYRVTYHLEAEPPVTIIIPTKNGAETLARCIQSIRNLTTYQNYSIMIVDNGSDEYQTLEYLKQFSKQGINVFVDNRPFNFSALNNRAVEQINHELVCLLNDDTEVISGDWLTEMVGHLLQPNVGIVGAKLLYPDNRVQHGGVILGIGGVAGHAHKHYEREADGYFSRLQVTQNLSAVTAACLLTKRSVWNEVGGMDEALSVAFNDIDYCLKVSEAGHTIVWTPWAELYHHESVSRGYETTPEKQERFRKEIELMRSRWGEKLLSDPHYNPHLTLEDESFSLKKVSEY